MSALPGLTPSEEAFFKSGGTDEAAVTKIREETNIPVMLPETPVEEPAETAADETTQPAKIESKLEAKPEEKPIQEVKFVPLEALQEERAEKKQLRDELNQFKAWQKQVEPILAQLPKAEQEQAPDPNTDPFGYQNWALGKLGTTVQEMQQWRQQQEQTARAQEQTQRILSWASQQAQAFQAKTPDFGDAYNFAKDSLTEELTALGYDQPSIEMELENRQAQIINAAAIRTQQGIPTNPAELVYNYAKVRGFTGKQPATSALDPNAAAKIAAGQAQAAKMNQGGQTADGEMTAKDLANIKDPVEFEKQWAKIFGKK